MLSTGDFGERTLRFSPTPDFISIVERIGHMPLPPYIHRDKLQPDTTEDRERYQTIYSQQSGSAAAPTAGLHFTPEILSALTARGVELAYVTLHVGLGTFQPVRVADTREIHLHSEPYTLSAETAQALNNAYRANRRIIAVGTTTTRTLEHLARQFESTHGPLSPTNPLALAAALRQHRPLPLACARRRRQLQARPRTAHQLSPARIHPAHARQRLRKWRQAVLRAYAHAVAARYRFFSYGDCMLIT